MYKDRLKPAVMETIYRCDTLPPSDDLDAWMTMAHRVETQYKDFLYWKNQHHPVQNTQNKPTAKPQQPTTTPVTNTMAKDPDAMNVDRKHNTFNCYNCRKPGHIAKNCQAPKKLFVTRVVEIDDEREAKIAADKNKMECMEKELAALKELVVKELILWKTCRVQKCGRCQKVSEKALASAYVLHTSRFPNALIYQRAEDDEGEKRGKRNMTSINNINNINIQN